MFDLLFQIQFVLGIVALGAAILSEALALLVEPHGYRCAPKLRRRARFWVGVGCAMLVVSGLFYWVIQQ